MESLPFIVKHSPNIADFQAAVEFHKAKQPGQNHSGRMPVTGPPASRPAEKNSPPFPFPFIFSACIWPICDCGISAITRGWTRISRPASICCWATTRRARRTSSKRFISWPRCGRSAASAARRWSGTAQKGYFVGGNVVGAGRARNQNVLVGAANANWRWTASR